MHVRYHDRFQRLEASYHCELEAHKTGQAPCQRVNGRMVDQAVSELVLRSFTPESVEIAFQIQEELRQRDEAIEVHGVEVIRGGHAVDP